MRRKQTKTNPWPEGYLDCLSQDVWQEARQVALYLNDCYNLAEARKFYENLDTDVISQFELDHAHLISDFIRKTAAARETFLDKITAETSENNRVLFLILAIIGLLRAGRVIRSLELLRGALTPGRVARGQAAATYDFADVLYPLHNYAWPAELIRILKLDDGSAWATSP